MKKFNLCIIVSIAILLVLMISGISLGADLPTYKDNLIDKVHQGYIASATQYVAIFVGYTYNLFWSLVLLDLLYHLVMFWKDGEGELGEFYTMIFFRILYAGFFFLIVDKGRDLTNFIYDTVVNDFGVAMINAGVGGGGSGVASAGIDPSNFLDIGFSIVFKITEKAGFWSGTGLMINIVALILIILFMLIMAEIVVAMVSFYLVAGIGYFLLAFGGLTATRSMVWNYFKTLFAMSFHIMTVYAVTTIAFGFIQEVAGTNAQQELIASDTESLLVLLAGVVLFAILAKKVPETVSSVITGAMFNGQVNSGAGSMITNMLSAGAGATAGLIAGGAGAGNAVNSAVQLAKTQQNSGSSDNSGGKGGGMGNTPQNLSSASGLAGQTLRNLASSVGSTIMAKGIKGENTFANGFGTMANHMDSKTNKANASDAVNNAYKVPTEQDISNTLKGGNIT